MNPSAESLQPRLGGHRAPGPLRPPRPTGPGQLPRRGPPPAPAPASSTSAAAWGRRERDAGLQMWLHKRQQEGNNHFLRPAGSALANVIQYPLAFIVHAHTRASTYLANCLRVWAASSRQLFILYFLQATQNLRTDFSKGDQSHTWMTAAAKGLVSMSRKWVLAWSHDVSSWSEFCCDSIKSSLSARHSLKSRAWFYFKILFWIMER